VQTYYNDPLEPVLRGATATRQGLLDITTFHYLTANMKPLDKLLAIGHTPETVTLALQLASNNATRAAALIKVGSVCQHVAVLLCSIVCVADVICELYSERCLIDFC
jgi:hypothetical protein